MPSTGIIDCNISVLAWDGGGSGSGLGAYRADLTFTAFWTGSAVVTLTPTFPSNPLNVRTNGGGSAWNTYLNTSGSTVQVMVVGQGVSPPTPVHWSVIGQVQTRS